MKRMPILLFVYAFFVLVLSSCGSMDTAPEKQIGYDIEDVLVDHQHAESIEYDISHDVDKDSRMDTVTVDLSADYNYFIIKERGTYVYQHDKASDIWSQYKTPEWSSMSVQHKEAPYIGIWKGTMYAMDNTRAEAEYILEIEDIDFVKGTVECTYNVSYFLPYQSDLPNEISGSGTFALYPVFDFGYGLIIEQMGYTNVFSLKGEPYGSTFYTSRGGMGSNSWIFDWSLLFSEEELNTLKEQIQVIGNKYRCGIYIATIEDASLTTPERMGEAVASIYSDFALGVENANNILLMINSDNNDCTIYATGPSFSQYGIEYLEEHIVKSTDAFDCSLRFLELSDDFLALGDANIPVDMLYSTSGE